MHRPHNLLWHVNWWMKQLLVHNPRQMAAEEMSLVWVIMTYNLVVSWKYMLPLNLSCSSVNFWVLQSCTVACRLVPLSIWRGRYGAWPPEVYDRNRLNFGLPLLCKLGSQFIWQSQRIISVIHDHCKSIAQYYLLACTYHSCHGWYFKIQSKIYSSQSLSQLHYIMT